MLEVVKERLSGVAKAVALVGLASPTAEAEPVSAPPLNSNPATYSISAETGFSHLSYPLAAETTYASISSISKPALAGGGSEGGVISDFFSRLKKALGETGLIALQVASLAGLGYLIFKKWFINEINVSQVGDFEGSGPMAFTPFTAHTRQLFGLDLYGFFKFNLAMLRRTRQEIPILFFNYRRSLDRLFKVPRGKIAAEVYGSFLAIETVAKARERLEQYSGEEAPRLPKGRRQLVMAYSLDEVDVTVSRANFYCVYDLINIAANPKQWFESINSPGYDVSPITKKLQRQLELAILLLHERPQYIRTLCPELKWDTKLSETFDRAQENSKQLFRLLTMDFTTGDKFLKDYLTGKEVETSLTHREQRRINKTVYGTSNQTRVKRLKDFQRRSDGGEHIPEKKMPPIYCIHVVGAVDWNGSYGSTPNSSVLEKG